MSERDALSGFLQKWQARWPEWRVAEVFLPAAQRERAQAWFALRDELAEAAWGGSDARPGELKLGWWAEELAGWSRGARRHPLGLALQKLPAPWHELAAALAGLRASREHAADLALALQACTPCAQAYAVIEQRLFDGEVLASVSAVPLLGECMLHRDDGADQTDLKPWARQLLAQWPRPAAGTRPGRIQAAIVQARLRRQLAGKPPGMPRLATLLAAWRAARGG